MKIEDLAYRIAGETLELLEKKYHYRITEEHKKDVQASIGASLNRILSESKEKKEA